MNPPASVMTLPDRLAESLVAFGAPLAGWRPLRHDSLEATLVEALRLSHQSATLLRVLPVVVHRNREQFDWPALVAGVRQAKLEHELGMLLELTGDLTGQHSFAAVMALLSRPSSALHPYFGRTSRYDTELAAERTPAAARHWGFSMNMTEESFRSLLAKFV